MALAMNVMIGYMNNCMK